MRINLAAGREDVVVNVRWRGVLEWRKEKGNREGRGIGGMLVDRELIGGREACKRF